MPLEAGTQVGRYTILRLLAQGGMAEVYRAEQSLTSGISRQVAVKVIRPEYSESPDFREMFLDEARTACTLSHPNIVHIYEVGETDEGQLYMAMELVSGETLATINRTMRDHGERFSDEALFAIGIWTAGALEAVHALKVEGGHAHLVHRDVSPHNLLLSSSGALKLIDFGIAKAATNRNLTMPGVTKGKAGYFSPEQAMGKKLDGRSDLFSLGVTLYKLASGETPFDDFRTQAERHAALVRGEWKALSALFPGMPRGYYEVVDRALGLKPEDRFQSAREMREALEKAAFDAGLRVTQSTLLDYVDDEGEITAGGGARSSVIPAVVPPKPSAPATDKVQRTRPPRPVPRWLIAGAAFVLAVVLGVVGFAVLFDPREPVAPVVQLPAPDPRPDPVLTPPDEPAPVPTPDEGVADPVPTEDPTPAPDPVDAQRPKTPVKVKPPKHPKTAKAQTPEKVEPPEAIPPGEGKLRINVAASSAAKILVGAEDWGEPPVNRKVSSGVYRVTVKLPDGTTASSKASVFPDQTTSMVFDASSQRWSTSSR